MSSLYNILQSLIVDDGISLIPVSEVGKNPFVKKWRDEPNLDIIQLYDMMTRYQTSAVAARLGDASGRLVCLDIDTKYKKGFEAILFQDLQNFYPDIFKKLRIEKTPSGGYHLFYRVSGEETLPNCPKIASRKSTDEELLANPKEPTKCFIEIKCNGGLTQVYPSPNYGRINENPIPVLSWSEHMSLMNLCGTYNEIIPVATLGRISKSVSDTYSQNPYEHFDNSAEAETILEDNGWNFYKSNNTYNYYRRPGKTDNEVSASFAPSKRLYKIFTAKTELDTKAYSPSNLLCALKFNGDKKMLYAHLVAQGYGIIKPNIEQHIIKKAALKGIPLPANISDDARFDYEMEVHRLKGKYPYGSFWAIDGETVHISREAIYRVSKDLGFRRHENEIVLIDGYKIKRVEQDYYYDALKRYIGKDEPENVYNSYEQFLQNSGKFTATRLDKLDTDLILKSSKYLSYKFFKNCYVRIEKDETEVLEYDNLDKLVWEENIQSRDFKIFKNYKTGLYYDYLLKAILKEKEDSVDDYLMKCIGYYAHDYKDEEGYWIIATESCENPADGAGSGKNVFWSLLGLTSTFKTTPASMIKYDNNLLQSWNRERIFVFADMPRDFDLIFFKDIITGNAVVNKKYINEYSVKLEDMPKIGGSSNYSFDNTDPGIKRRVRAIEFTDFFTKAGGVKSYYKKMFPKDWSELEYLCFDNFIIDCIQKYIEADTVIDERKLSDTGWKKQFSQKFNHMFEFIEQNISDFASAEIVSNDAFNTKYHSFCRDNNVKKPYSTKFINIAIQNYCLAFGIDFDPEHHIDSHTRARRFKLSEKPINPEELDDLPF